MYVTRKPIQCMSENFVFFFIGMIDAHNRCDQAGENGITRLAGVRCPQGLAFDIDRQTCDWKTRVKNCDKLDSKYDERPENVVYGL